MRVLLIDNFDSFTFNLARYFRELDCEVEVRRNNQLSIATIAALQPGLIVISPGPCTPNESGISLDVIQQFAGAIPILGVCLGHQAIAQVFGATIVKAASVMHGKVSKVVHQGHEMFANMPEKFDVTRYHSLVIQTSTLSSEFSVTAVTASQSDAEIMAIAHKHLPMWGVQFHPESHLTEYGHQLLSNILRLSSAVNLAPEAGSVHQL